MCRKLTLFDFAFERILLVLVPQLFEGSERESAVTMVIVMFLYTVSKGTTFAWCQKQKPSKMLLLVLIMVAIYEVSCRVISYQSGIFFSATVLLKWLNPPRFRRKSYPERKQHFPDFFPRFNSMD